MFYCFRSNIVGGEESKAVGPVKETLSCGKPVLESPFDHLEGISGRRKHPLFPEPEVALIFKKNEFDDPDLLSIESSLRQAVLEVSAISSISQFLLSLVRGGVGYSLIL